MAITFVGYVPCSSWVSLSVERSRNRLLLAYGNSPPTFTRTPRWWEKLFRREPAPVTFEHLMDSVWYLMTDKAGDVDAVTGTIVWEFTGVGDPPFTTEED